MIIALVIIIALVCFITGSAIVVFLALVKEINNKDKQNQK